MPYGVSDELHLAAVRGNVAAITTLLGSCRLELPHDDQSNRTVLQLAVSGGTQPHKEIASLLLSNGAKVTGALELAVLERQWDMVRMMAVRNHSLLSHQLETPPLRGLTLLECAYVVQEDPSQLPWLLQLGAVATYRALRAAVERGDHASLQAMLRSPEAAVDSCLHMKGWEATPGRTFKVYTPDQLRKYARRKLQCAREAVKKVLRWEQPPSEAAWQAAAALLQDLLPAGAPQHAQQGMPQWQAAAALLQALRHAGIEHRQLDEQQQEALGLAFDASQVQDWEATVGEEEIWDSGLPALHWPLEQVGQGLVGQAAGAAGVGIALPGQLHPVWLAGAEGAAAGGGGLQVGPAARRARRQRRAASWHTWLLGLLGLLAAQARLDEWVQGQMASLGALCNAWRQELQQVQQRLKDCWCWGIGEENDSCALLEGRASQLSTWLAAAHKQLQNWPPRDDACISCRAADVQQLLTQLTERLNDWDLPTRPLVIEDPPFWAGSLLHRAIQLQDGRAVALLLSSGGQQAGSGGSSSARPAAATVPAQLQQAAIGPASPWRCGIGFIDEAVIAAPAWDGLLAHELLPCFPWDCPYYQAVLEFHKAAERATSPELVAAADQACARVVNALLEGGAEPLLGWQALMNTELLWRHRTSATAGSIAGWSRLAHRFFPPNFKALVRQVLLCATADQGGLGKLPPPILDKVLRFASTGSAQPCCRCQGQWQ